MQITLDIAMVKKERGPTILLIGMSIWTCYKEMRALENVYCQSGLF